MMKISIFFAPGFEEIEALTPADVLRRAGFEVDLLGLEPVVEGAHQIKVTMDKVLDQVIDGYDLIVLPGGMPGADNLRKNHFVIESIKKQANSGKKVAAICAAPIVLEAAGLLEDRNFTNYPGFEEQISHGTYLDDRLFVVDGNITTSKGPGTALEFSYQLVDSLGGDAQTLKEDMQYNFLQEIIRKK
ncbi:DJ-1 family glyoxalase III [Eremococcus coleocola]|uniref:DJ-1 family protein n=1 Tax=Eremococcus coleocola ACS-139-V-Col8 TaxID=908337 RepID=E4KMI0_9LACT|nr:DJ-1 family glyoxalase III [Eremococcus coleocola]EFR31833.1 DJ-1 family protein [Eremococcus coleocola ACS-139-V-Col8]